MMTRSHGKTTLILKEIIRKLEKGESGVVLCQNGTVADEFVKRIKQGGHGAMIQVWATPTKELPKDDRVYIDESGQLPQGFAEWQKD